MLKVVNLTISVVSLLVSLVSSWVAVRAYKDVRYQDRPFIGAPKISKVVRSDGVPLYRFTFKNTGKVQADGVGEVFAIVKATEWEPEVATLCAAQRSTNFSERDRRFVALPSDDFVFSRQIPNSVQQADDPHLIGCIRYLWEGTEQQTAFVARLELDEHGNVATSYSVHPE